jgi:hypothetical protein
MAEPRRIGYFDESVIESEFKAKFNECFVQLIHPKLKKEFWLLHTNNDGSEVQFTNESGQTMSISGGTIKDNIEICVVFPKEGWYLCGPNLTPVLITRIPRKQWRRAPTKDNVICVSPREFITGPAALNTTTLNSTIYPIDISPLCTIINRKYLLKSYNDDWSILWYLNAVIGFYHKKKSTVFMLHSWYRLPNGLFKNVVYPKTFSLKDVK